MTASRLLVAFLGLLAALGVWANATPAKGDTRAHLDGLAARAPDGFYFPPKDVPDTPGRLLGSQRLKGVKLPYGMQGWRILYTTTIDDETRATAVATVFAPASLPREPLPVVIWEHGTTGLLQKCMPSLASQPATGIPALTQNANAGWAIVATDYSFAEKGGPHPYLIGEGEARAALDAMRAARQMPELKLQARAVVWGHSQGGHAALWTAMIGPRYAPEVGLIGVAAIAPAANMTNILALNPAVDKRLGPYVALSYSRFYPDVAFDQAVRPAALKPAREMAGLCSFLPPGDPQRSAALAASFDGPTLATDRNAALAARLSQNTADGPIGVPMLVVQGLSDAVVPPEATDAYVESRCAAGQALQYWRFRGFDHGRIVQPGSPLERPLAAWTAARFASAKADGGCVRKSF